ncbi:MAG: FGGY-family carbohydrate kinase [Bacteroidota bacterium]
MTLLAGIDLGTTALKGVIINESGKIFSSQKRTVNYQYGTGSSVEFSANEYYQTFCRLINDLLSHIPDYEQVAALSISGATGNTLLLDKNNEPLIDVISWLDQRPLDYPQVLEGLHYDEIHKTTGWPFLEIFPLAHLAWLKTKKPEVYHAASRYLMNISYLYYRLTNRFVIDHSTATTFYLQDQERGKWHRPLLDLLGINVSQLPELLPSSTLLGKLSQRACDETGLSPETEVVLGSFDHPAAARGAGVLKEGSLLLSCGTSWVGFYPVNNRQTGIDNGMLVDPFLSPDGPWAAMFSLPGLGNSIDALVSHLVHKNEISQKYRIFDLEAGQSSPAAEQLTIEITKPVEQLLIWLKKAEKHYSRGDLFRGIMNAVTFEVKRRIDHYEEKGVKADNITMVGGVSGSLLWTQVVANVTEKPIRLINGQMAGATGSAIMAGVGIGLFNNEEEGFNRIGGKPETVQPDEIKFRKD